uniref:Uncharacterized protein n=1 Tax=Odontella aurita TaxID=265563 RepID=A0A7S4IKF6_9STRA
MKTAFALVTLAASASAFAPARFGASRRTTAVFFEYGEYDEQLWDSEAKKDVYTKWDPNSPRSTKNFNPFETFEGNSPDASGIYPGETRYKDPIRPDTNFQQMMIEREEAEEREKNLKPGNVPGCPGCKN